MEKKPFRLSVRWIALAVTALLFSGISANAQQEKPQTPVKKKNPAAVFPDEYSDLDDNNSKGAVSDEINQKLEESRQYYLRGLSQIERGDTTKAAKLFESAIDILNELASTPGIERNEDYSDLAQSILEDYESYVRSIDNLDENSSMFILREKIFQEMDQYAQSKSGVQPFKVGVDNQTKNGSLITSIPLTQNEYVARSITFLTDPASAGKKYFKNWIARTGKWFPLLKRIAREEKMPEEIIHLAMIESGLNPNAVSRAKAVGMWQFMQSTGSLYGLRVTQWVDERRDPEKATRAAMRHLRDLYTEFGDWHLALAAYNCGAGGVKRAIKASGIENPDYWQVRDFLPKETRGYVPIFCAAALVTMQHEAYGFKAEEINFEPEYQIDTYVIKEPVALKAIAKCANISLDSLMHLNPELLRNSTPPEGEYRVKIPAGIKEDFVASLTALTPEEKQPWITHEVRKGETLASIAAVYGIPASEIASANMLGGYRVKLRRGSVLKIPTDVASVVPNTGNLASNSSTSNQSTTNDSSNDNSTDNDATETGNDVKPTQVTPATGNTKRLMHMVSNGETLFSIANRYGVRLTDLRNWNNLSYDEDNVQAGSTLVINLTNVNNSANANTPIPQITKGETKSIAVSTEPVTQPTITKKEQPEQKEKSETKVVKIPRQVAKVVVHKVNRGETLAQIADDYNTTIQAISKMNGLKPKKGLLAGQLLKIETKVNSEEPSVAANKKHEAAEEEPQGKATVVKVRKGDNIGTLAAKYGVRESQLIKWNPSLAEGKVLAGQNIKVYTPQTSKGSASSTPKTINKLPKSYTVRNGDTMYSIANRYGVTVAQLQAKNKGLEPSTIRIGQKIRLQ
ncbi:MAG: LysM peptidoglycan-binding domain-containing protein [Bacteriodetes bacterium]|nr:LysM peptidoglycan-binding domain-containing protein [Bacteroidota bacterium]